MNLALSTPALLFPAISLLFLAYTNRFLHLAALIRKLHADAMRGSDPLAVEQIGNLRRRLSLIRWMQIWGVAALLGCTLAMVAIFFSLDAIGGLLFVASVLMMSTSLALSLREIAISGGALAILLRQLETRR
jgi:hypothetical protein